MVEFEPHWRSHVMPPEAIPSYLVMPLLPRTAYEVNTPFREVVARLMVSAYVN